MYFLKNKIDNVIILLEHEPSDEMLEAYLITTEEHYQEYLRINELKQMLSKTDYQAIKFAEGALSQQEYEPVRVQRQSWRDEINLLESYLI